MKIPKLFTPLAVGMIVALGLISVSRPASVAAAPMHGRHKAVCSTTQLPNVYCSAYVLVDNSGNPAATTGPTGYGPAQFHGAYNLPNTAAHPATIAVVDAYDQPFIKSNLDTYDATYGLPNFPSCSNTVTTGCFSKVNQQGRASYPAVSSGWSLETSLDVETAHQTCQNCKLLLVEAKSSSYANLMAAIDTARALGATVISNSYGSGEFASETVYDSHFNHPGVAFLFSAGDSSYGATYPAASPYVTAVGGTSLSVNPNPSNTWQSETVWSGTGSGCSAYELKPAFQTDANCSKRTINDVAADADPNTGAAVYDTVSYQGYRGWFQVGGTSLSAPLVAGIYGLADNLSPTTQANAVPYANHVYGVNLHDITAGSNGVCSSYLCQAGTGFDGPTGLGTPIGLGAF
jgi:subtilase family serine protease